MGMTLDADTQIVYQIIHEDGSTCEDSQDNNKVSNVIRILSEEDLIASKQKKKIQHQATLDCQDDDGAKEFCGAIREGKKVKTTFTVNVYSDNDNCCANLKKSFSYCGCEKVCRDQLNKQHVFKVTVDGTNYKIWEEKKVKKSGQTQSGRRLLTTLVRGGGHGC